MIRRLVLLAAFAMHPAMLWAEDLDISGYQKPDGAITAMYQSDVVDPYFATRALLIAQDGGLDIEAPAKAWISWAIKKQASDGLFNRYKRNASGGWDSFEITDADDAALALWLELLYRAQPDGGMPEAWKNSVEKARAQLATLLDPEQGIYHVSLALPVGLLMDNVEIYASFKQIAQVEKNLGHEKEAQAYEDSADKLSKNILQVFGGKDGTFLVSTQAKENGHAFYPDKVAQIYPVIYQVQNDKNAHEHYRHWMRANGKEWLAQRTDDFAWGLVAVLALDMDDIYSAACWRQRAEPMRYSKHWNVLEEVALQDVKWHLHVNHDDAGVPCVGGNLS